VIGRKVENTGSIKAQRARVVELIAAAFDDGSVIRPMMAEISKMATNMLG
jgi:hypothetical protein